MPTDTLTIADEYTVLETVARGGMGVIYKALQENLNRVVAVKMLLGGVHASESFRQRFLQEAKSAARLSHPNIVSIHDWGEDSGQPFFSMEFVDGQNLADLALKTPLAPRAAAEMVCTLAKAIHYAHSQGVLHRDLKPSNVLIDSAGILRITDFGLARQLGSETGITSVGDFLGTPGYLPPEQMFAQAQPVGPRSDVYGLGAILYYLLTSRPPHGAGSVAEAMRAVIESDPISPQQLNPSVPTDLQTICLKCLEKRPDRRYPSADALAEDLHRWLNGEPIHARPVRLWERGLKWTKRNPSISALSACLVLVIILGFASVTEQKNKLESLLETLARQQRNQMTEGELLSTKGDLLGGEAALGNSMELSRALLGAESANLQFQLLYAVNQRYIGNLLYRKRNNTEALKAYSESVDVLRQLITQDQTNSDVADALAQGLTEIGWLSEIKGDFDAALKTYEEVLALEQRFAAQLPRNIQWQGRVAGSSRNIYRQLASKGEFENAFQALERALAASQEQSRRAIAKGADEADPLKFEYPYLSESALSRHDYKSAVHVYRKMGGLIQSRIDQGDAKPEMHLSAVKTQMAIGKVLATQGNRSIALMEYEQARTLADKFKITDEALIGEIRSQIMALTRSP